MRWFLIVLAVLALAFAGAGCGGGDDESAGDTETTAITDSVSTDETTDETTDESTTDGTDTDISDFDFSSEECRDLVERGNRVQPGDRIRRDRRTTSRRGRGVPGVRRQRTGGDPRRHPDARGRVRRVSSRSLGDVDLQPGETPSAEQIAQLTQALSSINSADVTAASERIGTWATRRTAAPAAERTAARRDVRGAPIEETSEGPNTFCP